MKNESWYSSILKWINSNLTYIYFTIAIIFILYPNTRYSLFSESWGTLIEKIGFIALTSGVFASVLKSIQFTGLFKEELNKVISGSDFLNNRKDLPDLWKKISKILYSQKFPEISEILEDRILNTYFPTNSNHYNQDVVITINIDSIDKDMVITYTQTIQYTAILDSENNSSILSFSSSLTDTENLIETNQLICIKIDNEDFTDKIQPSNIKKDGKEVHTFSYELKGKKKFDIYHKMKKKYSLKGENYKLLRFTNITRNVDVTISHPKDIEVSFFGIGVVNEFKEIHANIGNVICRRHQDDLILPQQGFGLSFNKKI